MPDSSWASKAEWYREKAEENRSMARHLRHEGARAAFLKLAEEYEALARGALELALREVHKP